MKYGQVDREKIFARVSPEMDVEAIVSSIENEINTSLATEISTAKIGEMVMERLREIDAVSYVRFASVYREFRDVDTFFEELQEVIRQKGAKK